MRKIFLLVLAVLAVVGIGFTGRAADVVIKVGEGDHTLEKEEIAGLGATDNLVKTGDGRLIVGLDIATLKPSWTGAVKVEKGTYKVAHAGAFGPASGAGAFVSSGATVEFDGAALGSTDLTCGRMSVEGTGADGAGAVRVTGANWSHKNFYITLTGDALWSYPDGKVEIFNYPPAGALDMGGHTLTVKGSGSGGQIQLNSGTDGFIANPGHFVIDGKANLKTEQTRFIGSEANTITFKADSTWTVANNPKGKCNWKIVIEEGVNVAVAAISWSAQWPTQTCGWSGPIEIGEGGCLEWVANYSSGSPTLSFVIDGKISGAGKLQSDYGYLLLTNPQNSIAEIRNYQSRLIASSLSAVMPAFGTSGKFYTNYSGATSLVQVVSADMTAENDAAVLNFMQNYPTGFCVNNGVTLLSFASDYSYSSEFSSAFKDLSVYTGGIPEVGGSAAFTLSGGVTGSNPLAVKKAQSSLVLANDGGNALGQLQLSNGETVFESGFYDLGTGRHYIGAAYPGVARMTVGAGAVLGNGNATGSATTINVGRSPLGAEHTVRGILTLDGGTITNHVSMIDGIGTSAPRSQGSFVMKSGDYYCHDSSGEQVVTVGSEIGGYFSLRGGTFTFPAGWFPIGMGANGYGVFEMLGGTYTHAANGIGVGRNAGHGHFYLAGGTATLNSLRLCHTIWSSAALSPNVRSVCTIAGDANLTAKELQLGASSDSVTILNLNGGVCSIPAGFGILTNSRQINASMADFQFTNNLVCVNLNGGELNPRAASSDLFSKDADDRLRVVVGKGGFRLNTLRSDGAKMVFTDYRPLNPPTGRGIGSIPVPEAAPWEYTGAPYVEITGDGWGASALAQFDNENGVITNVLVTSPGCDYTWAKAKFVKGGAAEDLEVTLDEYLVENDTSGGLFVYGGGTLVLAGANKYCGETRVGKDTTLQFWTWAHYPNDGWGKPLSDVVNEGGTFMLGAPNSTEIIFPKMSGYGEFKGGCGEDLFSVQVKEALCVDAKDLLAGRVPKVLGKLTFQNGAKIRITSPEALSSLEPGTRLTVAEVTKGVVATGLPEIEGLDENWKVRLGTGGISLRRRGSGMVLILR